MAVEAACCDFPEEDSAVLPDDRKEEGNDQEEGQVAVEVYPDVAAPEELVFAVEEHKAVAAEVVVAHIARGEPDSYYYHQHP